MPKQVILAVSAESHQPDRAVSSDGLSASKSTWLGVSIDTTSTSAVAVSAFYARTSKQFSFPFWAVLAVMGLILRFWSIFEAMITNSMRRRLNRILWCFGDRLKISFDRTVFSCTSVPLHFITNNSGKYVDLRFLRFCEVLAACDAENSD